MRTFAIALALICALSPGAVAQSGLDSVRGLYAAADYEAALEALSRLNDPPPDASTVREKEHYRALCLVALNRLPEAEQAIESILTKDPLYRLTAEDAAPRVRAAFDRVRRRVVPAVARRLYEDGKRAYERQAFQEALELLERGLRIMNDPATADTPGLSDFKVLATGFRDLSRASLARVPSDPPASHAEAVRTAAGGTGVATDAVPLQQDLPPWPGAAAGSRFDRVFNGTIEIEINAAGQVTRARIATPIHPEYDQQLLASARTWRYEPARQAGKAVPSRKRIDIRLRPR